MSAAPGGSAVRRRSRRLWPRVRADLRLAWRHLLRARGSSVLVMLLVVLPVAGLAGGAIFWQSHVATRAQQADLELGHTQAWIRAVGPPDPRRWQAVDQPWESGVDGSEAVGADGDRPTDPFALLPPGAGVHTLTEWGALLVGTPAGAARVSATAGDSWDPVFAGRYVVLEGERPTRDDQAMATPGLLQRTGAEIGDRVVLAESNEALTITGTMRRADTDPAVPEIFVPPSFAASVDGEPVWFTAHWQPDVEQLRALNHAGFVAFARDLVTAPPPDARVSATSDRSGETGMLLTGLGIAVLSGYLVVLLAGAAFAVSARHQQRWLAVASSIGATRADVFRIILFQGTVLGALAGTIGVALGAGLAAVALALTDRGVANGFWGNWGYRVPWPLVLAVAGFAVVVGTLAAIAPARSATRGDTLAALRGATRPPRPHRRTSVWGILIAVAGLLVTLGAGVLLGVIGTTDRPALRTIGTTALLAGPVIFQIGFLLAGRAVLTAVARLFAGLGLGARLAARDAAAHAPRIVPAVAAITGCVFLATFALGTTAVTAATNARAYGYLGPQGSVIVWMSQNGSSASDTLISAARALVAPTEPRATALVSAPLPPEYDTRTGRVVDPLAPVYAVARYPSPTCSTCGVAADLMGTDLWIVAPEAVETLLGAAVDPDILRAYRDDGRAIATDPGVVGPDGELTITQWTQQSQAAFYDTMYRQATDPPVPDDEIPRPLGEHRLAASRVDIGHSHQAQALISPRTAESLGIRIVPSRLVAVYADPPDDATLDRLTQQAESLRLPGDAVVMPSRENGPTPTDPWMWLIVAVALVLVVGAGAVCLGLARYERRPDDATLSAVGGTVWLRRSINGWQAVMVVGIGSLVGTASGLVPVWGASQSGAAGFGGNDLPWGWLALLALVLPVAIGAVAWLVRPRSPDLTRRTAIA